MVKDLKQTKIYKDIVARKMHCYFISPHFDDAILSAGSLMWQLKENKVPMTVINIFTAPSPKPYTFSVQKFLRSCGYKDANKLYTDRELEDKKVIIKTGAKVINLGFTDALWRRKEIPGFLKSLAKIIPEVEYIYPVFSVGMKLGWVSRHDIILKSHITLELKKIIKNGSMVFGPVAVGKHMDHTIVRDVIGESFPGAAYWEDYPYSRRNVANEKFIKKHNLTSYYVQNKGKIKDTLVNGYVSQVKALFGSDKVHIKTNEKFFI